MQLSPIHTVTAGLQHKVPTCSIEIQTHTHMIKEPLGIIWGSISCLRNMQIAGAEDQNNKNLWKCGIGTLSPDENNSKCEFLGIKC